MSGVNRTIVSIEPYGDETDAQLVMRLEQTPFAIKRTRINSPVDMTGLPSQDDGDGWILQCGQALLERLRNNKEVKNALSAALVQPANEASHPICFQISSPLAGGHAWEALHTGSSFAALDPRWPIARVVADAEGANDYVLEQPLRVLAILSAAGCPACGEWDGLLEAMRSAKVLGMPVEARVFVGESELLDTITALDDPAIHVAGIPHAFEELRRHIEEFRPQILHLYGHGGIASGLRRLEFASISDWDANQADGSVRYALEELAEAAATSGVWLVVLNACRTGATTPDSYAFASDLVARGIPAAVGMRNAVECDDAHIFCRAFYDDLLRRLSKVVASAADKRHVGFEWADILGAARRTLRDTHGADPATSHEWTLPVLYTRRDVFRVLVSTPELPADAARELIGQAHTLAAFEALAKQSLPPGLLEAARDQTEQAFAKLATSTDPSQDGSPGTAGA